MMSIPLFVMLIIGVFYFFIDLFVGFDKIYQNELLQNKFFVLLWILSLFLIMGYIGAVSYVEQRYITAGLPFLFLIAVSLFVWAEDVLSNYLKLNKKFVIFTILLIIIFLSIPNLNLANSMIDQKKTSYMEVKQAGEWIKENSNTADIVISTSLPQITYYSERSTYPFDIWNARDNKEKEKFAKYGDGEEGFNEFLKEYKPRYLILSIFESHDEWMYKYPQKQNNTLIPVQVYQQNKQPVLVVYEVKYS